YGYPQGGGPTPAADSPDAWEQPWSGEYIWKASKDMVYEYACHEGNYAMTGILAGARRKEAEAAKE
ncbi:MAG: hypothetical protein CMQ41_04505, partial [Gammaproteobacteria bacterium]|nr:hypothetical protein [Gammaproteobacteria bacterium]